MYLIHFHLQGCFRFVYFFLYLQCLEIQIRLPFKCGFIYACHFGFDELIVLFLYNHIYVTYFECECTPKLLFLSSISNLTVKECFKFYYSFACSLIPSFNKSQKLGQITNITFSNTKLVSCHKEN